MFKTEIAQSESETDVSDASPVHSIYINSMISRLLSHDPTFGEHQDDTDSWVKIGWPNFKYKDKRIFVGGKMYKERSVFGNR